MNFWCFAAAACPFCRISESDPQRLAYNDEHFVAFDDRNPGAKEHILVIPREHIESVYDISSKQLVQGMMDRGNAVLEARGVPEADRVLGFHVPPFTSVKHVHLHALGKPFKSWFRKIKYTPSLWYVDAETAVNRLDNRKGDL